MNDPMKRLKENDIEAIAIGESMPDVERRRLLKKLALVGVAAPTALLLVDGSKNVLFATP